MVKTMQAKYPGKCRATGAAIKPGDTIQYDTRTRSAVLAQRSRSQGYVSDVFNIGGREYYRNKGGRCEDAPCCGCCTI